MRTLLLFVPAAVLIAGCCHTPHTDALAKRLSTAKTRDDLKSYCAKEGGVYHGRALKPNTALISYYINVEEERKRSYLIFDPLTLILEGLRDNWVIVRHTDTITVTYDVDGKIVRYDRPQTQPSPPERIRYSTRRYP